MDYWSMFDEWALVIKRLFPGAELPDTPVHLLSDMERLQTRTHPLLPGVILGNEKWIIVDHENVIRED